MPTPQQSWTGSAALVRRLAEGRDEAAWEALLALHGRELYSLAYRILGQHALAEDACQEALLQVREHARRFSCQAPDADKKARHWLLRIACNAALQMIREQKRIDRFKQRLEEKTQEAAPPDPETLETLGALRAELAHLPEILQQAVALRFYGNLNPDEIAAQLRCPVGTVKARVHRGVEQLRTRLKSLGFVLALPNLEALLQERHPPGDLPPLPDPTHWHSLLTSAARPRFRPPAQGLTLMLMAKISLAGSMLLMVAAAAVTLSSSQGADSPTDGEKKPPLAAEAPQASAKADPVALVETIQKGERTLDGLRLTLSDRKRMIVLFGKGRMAFGAETRANRYFTLAEKDITALLEPLTKLSPAAQNPVTPGYTLRMELDGSTHLLQAAADAPPDSAVAALVLNALKLTDSAPALAVDSIAQGLQRLRDGEIPAEFLSLNFMFSNPALRPVKVGDHGFTWMIQLTGRQVTDITTVVSRLREVSLGLGNKKVSVPEFDQNSHSLELSDDEFQSILKLLIECQVGDLYDKPDHLSLGIAIGRTQVGDKQAPTVVLKPDPAPLPEEPARWKKLRETLAQLHLRTLKEGATGSRAFKRPSPR